MQFRNAQTEPIEARVIRARTVDMERAHDCAIELRFSLSRIERDRFLAGHPIPAWAHDVFQPSASTLRALLAMLESERGE